MTCQMRQGLAHFLAPIASIPPGALLPSRQSVEHMARALLRRRGALSSLLSAAAPTAPRLVPSLSSAAALAQLRSPLDERLLRLLRSEISYVADRRPPHQPPTSFRSFAVEDRPGEQWVRLRAARRGPGAGEEAIKIDATLFDGVAELPPDASLFNRVEALEQGPRLHLSLIVEVARADRVLGFICSAWPDNLTVRHVLTLRGAGAATDDRGARDFTKLEPAEREAVKKFLQEREVDAELAEFLHDYVANKEKMEMLRWLKTVESFVEK
uniref:Mitochondrial glycoprotein n=2 Tax=Aegilops tauschii subsp. strangulata TaxID=200361 RepID=A0A453LLV9_AEGTS